MAAGSLPAAKPGDKDAELLRASAEKWKLAREECGGNYTYSVVRSSFTGARQTTTVVVQNNKVVERRYQEFAGGPPMLAKPGEKPIEAKPKWIETGKEIGSNKEPRAAAARTLDELYQEASKLVEAKVPENHQRTLGFDKQGILAYCFTQDKRIADDAPIQGVAPLRLELHKKQ